MKQSFVNDLGQTLFKSVPFEFKKKILGGKLLILNDKYINIYFQKMMCTVFNHLLC